MKPEALEVLGFADVYFTSTNVFKRSVRGVSVVQAKKLSAKVIPLQQNLVKDLNMLVGWQKLNNAIINYTEMCQTDSINVYANVAYSHIQLVPQSHTQLHLHTNIGYSTNTRYQKTCSIERTTTDEGVGVLWFSLF